MPKKKKKKDVAKIEHVYPFDTGAGSINAAKWFQEELDDLVESEAEHRKLIERKDAFGIFAVTIVAMLANVYHSYPKTNNAVEPPKYAETLLMLFLPKDELDAIVGDLSERFESDIAKGMSVKRAGRRYRAYAFRSLGPSMWAAFKKMGFIALAIRAVKSFMR